MKKIAVIGAGISGAACARLLSSKGHRVVVYEDGASVGGLIKCTDENGNLFHRVGGHVFNAKDRAVSEWFWSHFDAEAEFLFSHRNAVISMENGFVGYPIENHIYQLEEDAAAKIINELLDIAKRRQGKKTLTNAGTSFKDFLLNTFGQSLCDSYFIPYNNKIWRQDLSTIPLEWLDGKLPMPKIEEIINANILRKEETGMVHSRFYYPKKGGSQFIINRLMEEIEIRLKTRIEAMEIGDDVEILGEHFDAVIYTGDVRKIADVIGSKDARLTTLSALRSNGTTTALCIADANPYSWVYIPDDDFRCHRIIMTGNFAKSNNAESLKAGRISCTVEFVGQATNDEIQAAISKLPFKLDLVATNYEPNSYIIQSKSSREQINEAKLMLSRNKVWLCGRFAEWEYYNMDAAIGAAMKTAASVISELEKSA